MVGYVLTAAWIVMVVMETDGDMEHPLFNYIFLVPLAGWIVAMIGAGTVKVMMGRKKPQSGSPDRRTLLTHYLPPFRSPSIKDEDRYDRRAIQSPLCFASLTAGETAPRRIITPLPWPIPRPGTSCGRKIRPLC